MFMLWDRSTKGHRIPQRTKIRHKTVRARSVEVLGYFQTVDEVEAPIQAQRLREILPEEPIARNQELVDLHDITVDTKNLATRLGIGLRPGTGPAPHIDHRLGRDQSQQQRDNLPRRNCGILLQSLVIPGRIGAHAAEG